MAFISSFMYSLDTKKRILIPNKFRDELGDVFYITRSLDACLTIYPEEEWNLFLKGLKDIPSTTSAIAMEYFMSAAQKCTPDGSGRVLLEKNLIDHSKIDKNAVFVGAGNTINIWSEELWAAREANRDLESIRALLQQHGL